MAPALDLTLMTSSGERVTRFPLSTQSTSIGRLPTNAIQIIHACISDEHATIELRHGHVYVHDQSLNGTWLNGARLLRDGPGICLRYDDELEFGLAPDFARPMNDPFRAHATFRLTMPQCTPLGQRSPLVQMSAPIPLAAELAPNQCPSALPNPSASEEPMPPPPKRSRLGESIAAPDAPLADAPPPHSAAGPPVVALPPVAEPLAEAPAVAPADVLSQHWHVFGNDPNDSSGIRSVLLAEHSRGKPEAMVLAAFPHLSDEEVASFVAMDASNVFRQKKGGKKDDAIVDAKTTCKKLIELVGEHGSNLRVWGCGGGMDRIIQISTLTGFVQADNMRPLTFKLSASGWQDLGIRYNEANAESRRTNSLNLTSASNGTGTYRCEIWRNGECETHFFLGVYPHPGSMSWGGVESRPHEHAKFLCDLANGTPSQERVIKINADDFP